MTDSARPWRLWIDTGGTFTDCMAVAPDLSIRRVKVLSSGAVRGHVSPDPQSASMLRWSSGRGLAPDGFFDGCTVRAVGSATAPAVIKHSTEGGELRLDREWPAGECEAEIKTGDEAAVLAARIATGSPPGRGLPLVEVRFATTRGTNALLERRGKAPILFVTRGFGDLLAIGNQQRPDLFSLEVIRSPPLYADVVEVDERVLADGTVHRPLDLAAVEGPARAALSAGQTVAAVALLHSYRSPAHEEQLAAYLKEIGFRHVSTSSQLSSRIKIVPRAETAVVDAYLAVVVGDYLRVVGEELGACSLHVMTSAGGLVRDSQYHAKDSLLSGPAGGVVGAVAAGRSCGADRLLAFDMGGTSTDVTRYDGDFEYRSETVVGGARLSSPSLAVETVAAGGGSICRFDGYQLKVGPESAGADPGPACYGMRGPLTLTDVNLLLGRLEESRFPFRVDLDAAEEEARRIARQYGAGDGLEISTEELLFGFLRIANEKMAGAVRSISLRAGYHPADYTLLTFGGAGPQHACALADLLGVGQVVVPADAALLSAFGLAYAKLERFAERQVLEPLECAQPKMSRWFAELEAQAVHLLEQEGVATNRARVRRREAFLRFVGQEATLGLEWWEDLDIGAAFAAAYQAHFGYRPEGRKIEVESLQLIASEGGRGDGETLPPPATRLGDSRSTRRPMYSAVGWVEAELVERSGRAAGGLLFGPALVVEEHTATVVEPGWKARVGEDGALLLEKV